MDAANKSHASEEELKDTAKLLGRDKDGDEDEDETIYEQKIKLKEKDLDNKLQNEDERLSNEKRARNHSKCLCCGVVMRTVKSTSLYSLVR